MKIKVVFGYNDETIKKGDTIHQPSLAIDMPPDGLSFCYKETFRITAERIKALREENNLSQTQLAKILNVTQKEYWRLECQDYKPNIIRLVELAYFYNVTMDYIVGISDDKKPISVENIFELNGYCLDDFKKK